MKITLVIVIFSLLYVADFSVAQKSVASGNLIYLHCVAAGFLLLQYAVFALLRQLIRQRKVQSVTSQSCYIIRRIIAKALDFIAAWFLSIIVLVAMRGVAEREFSLIASVCAGVGVLLLMDGVFKKGSLGKRLVGLSIGANAGYFLNHRFLGSIFRNLVTTAFFFLLVLLSDLEYRHDMLLSFFQVMIFVILALDFIFLRKTGVRFLDHKMNLKVSIDQK